MIDEGSILDVGCGDLEVFAPLPAINYVGIDHSEQALSIALTKRPDWNFYATNIPDIKSSSFDYCVCIDVLIHQPNERAARALARDIVRVSRKGVIFSAHSVEIGGSGISFNSAYIKDFIVGLRGCLGHLRGLQLS